MPGRGASFDGRRRVVIDAVRPSVSGGRAPVKRIQGEPLLVEADILVDGHDLLAGVLLYRKGEDGPWHEVALTAKGNDRYAASFTPRELGRWHYTVEAWVDEIGSWRRGLGKKVEAGVPVGLELLEGADLLGAAASRARVPADRDKLRAAAAALADRGMPDDRRVAIALDDTVAALAAAHPDRGFSSRFEPLQVVIDPLRARFASRYEFFPRSTGAPGRHGTFKDAEARLDDIAQMGFDIVYLPPIHPIGRTFRKGKNNTLQAGPDEPGSPWAIGAAEGGHDAIHPELGTEEDFARFVRRARALGLEIALDLAFQASPDHPYVGAHPEWFVRRPDGTIAYAENPPKKYQDIYPFALAGEAWESLWRELLRVVEVWIDRGIKVFRVDNPHTKPLPFWEWLIGEVKARHPEIVFLAEAFTRPKLMYSLAKLGFTQSYTYFTWRTTREELREYMTEVTTGEVAEFFRPNLWPNTPDILPEHLQHGGRPTFIARAVLAATLSSSYGIYGPAFELLEHVPRPGSEEYIDNEKFELKQWDLERPDSLRPILTRLNRIRRENPALQDNRGLRFHETDNPLLLAYSKLAGDNLILAVVNLDARHRHAGWVDLDLEALGLTEKETFQVHDLLSEARYSWRGRRAYVELDPETMPAHVFRLRRFARREADFEYFA